MEQVKPAPRQAKGNAWVNLMLDLVSAMLLLLIYGGGGYVIYRYWRVGLEFLTGLTIQSVVTAAPFWIAISVIAALCLYLLRTAARIHYGFTEIMFGVISIAAAAQTFTAQAQSTTLVQLAGGIYIIVRGLDNIKHGLDENPSSRVWKIWNLMFSEDRINRLKQLLAMRVPD